MFVCSILLLCEFWMEWNVCYYIFRHKLLHKFCFEGMRDKEILHVCHPSIHSSTCIYTFTFIHSSIIHLSTIHPTLHIFLHSSFNSYGSIYFHSSIHLFIHHPSSTLPTYPSVHPSIQPSMYVSLPPSVTDIIKLRLS